MEYNDRIEALGATSYSQVALLKQSKGVGTLIGLTFLLTRLLAKRCGSSSGRRNSGESEPQGIQRFAVLGYFCGSSVPGVSVFFGDAVSVFNRSASAIRRRISDSMLRLSAGSVDWFISNRFFSSWRATFANSRLT